MSAEPNRDSLSGLEFMQAIVEEKIPMPAMAQTIPMKCIAAESGAVTFWARADGRHTNRSDNIHGGFAATVMDSVASCALRTLLEPGARFVTIELNVKLLRPVPRDTDLRGEGKAIHVSRQLGVSEARLFDAAGKLCAHCTATFVITR